MCGHPSYFSHKKSHPQSLLFSSNNPFFLISSFQTSQTPSMAASSFTTFLPNTSHHHHLTPKLPLFHSLPLTKSLQTTSPIFLDPTRTHRTRILPLHRASSQTPASTKADERVQKVHTIQEFDDALRAAKDRLVVVEFSTKEAESDQAEQPPIYPFMVELSRTCNDVVFILVMADESDTTAALCRRENIHRFPHFTFYKSMQKIHEEEAIGPDTLIGDVLYYGDSHSEVVQLHSGDDVRQLIEDHTAEKDNKLVVLDVGLKHCGPCVKVYPTVVKLSKQMETVVFARMNGDENESCMDFLREMEVVQVPTFLFIRDGKICGRYVGSGKGELIGEILRYQGVRVTY